MALFTSKVGQSGQPLSSVEAKILFTVPATASDGEMNIIRATSGVQIFIAFGYKPTSQNFDILLKDGQGTYFSNGIVAGPCYGITDTDGTLVHSFCPYSEKEI